jgi:hypothetical protein
MAQSKDEMVLTEPTGADAALLPSYSIPTRASGALASYRASDLGAAAGTAVTSWTEHSAGTAFGASTGVTMRTSPIKYLELSASTDLNRATPASAVTRFYVFQVPALPGAGVTKAIAGSSVSSGGDRQEFGIDTSGHWYTSNGTVLSSSHLADTNWHLACVVDAGASSTIRIDDFPTETGNSGASAQGANFKLAQDGNYASNVHWAANFAEVDFYGTLTADQIEATVEAIMIDFASVIA